MDFERRVLRISTAVIAGAIFLRILSGLPQGKLPEIDKEAVTTAILFFQTGQILQTKEEPVIVTEPETQPAVTETQPLAEVQHTVLAREDAARVELWNMTNYTVDVESLLLQPLSRAVNGEKPAILILHTHGTESFQNTENYSESSDYHTLEEAYNMISVGAYLTKLLEEGGLQVIHDRSVYDYPSYSGAYEQARKGIRKTLEDNPGICLILDLHRDAMADSYGQQVRYAQDTDRGTVAKIMLVAGTDVGGLTHPYWQENLCLAVKLQALLEREQPGICRPLSLRTGRFNQDLFPNMVLVEMGAAGNTRQEALLAAEFLAKGILQLTELSEQTAE